MYLRMVIGEVINEDQIREFRNIFKEECAAILREEPGFQRGDLATEEDGRMAVIITVWDTWDNCLKHHSSRAYATRRQNPTPACRKLRGQALPDGVVIVEAFIDALREPRTAEQALACGTPPLLQSCIRGTVSPSLHVWIEATQTRSPVPTDGETGIVPSRIAEPSVPKPRATCLWLFFQTRIT